MQHLCCSNVWGCSPRMAKRAKKSCTPYRAEGCRPHDWQKVIFLSGSVLNTVSMISVFRKNIEDASKLACSFRIGCASAHVCLAAFFAFLDVPDSGHTESGLEVRWALMSLPFSSNLWRVGGRLLRNWNVTSFPSHTATSLRATLCTDSLEQESPKPRSFRGLSPAVMHECGQQAREDNWNMCMVYRVALSLQPHDMVEVKMPQHDSGWSSRQTAELALI